MLTFVKFGGSVITDKRGQEAPDLAIISQLTRELSAARTAQLDSNFVVGHGSGSFGHVYAARYGIHRGLNPEDDWMGFALTARAARRLHGIMIDALLAAGIPALSLQPSASLHSRGGELVHWHTDSLANALRYRLVPVIHGDVSFDEAQGSAIISTEALFVQLALQTPMRPNRIVLVGENAVYTADPNRSRSARLIPLITEHNIDTVLNYAGESRAVDVTGGMRSKLALTWQLVQALPGLEVFIIGADPGLLTYVLQSPTQSDPPPAATLIRQN
jgi:isopentenyl phosphate kinase